MVTLVNMEHRTCYFAALFFFVAFILLTLTAISLPAISGMDITRVNMGSGTTLTAANETVTQLRFGIWAYCYDLSSGTSQCGASAVSIKGYSVIVSNQTDTVDIVASWTRGLTLHVVAAIATFLALLFCFFRRISVFLLASSVTACLSAIASFVVDAILYVYIKSQMTDLGFGANTKPSHAFWMTLASVILLLVGGGPLWLGGCWRSLANQKVIVEAPRERVVKGSAKIPWLC
ncbi:hypothetical protein EDD16DRAFT_467628 [Pisolithus croceorrhizus]|nr:hypothetical protein EDD16DRAFT_467628 [Pisolithus croceorrhizus]KAI6106955.1 hypothetical protein EV401DRAFT_470680 [Pisolithus croceorrhizus]KAI6158436.1 hypothetical protein EDD17DRAFT_1008015 [Pisolithus thermaeus]